MEQTRIQILVLVVTIIVIVLAATLVVFLLYFQKKKTAYILKQREIQQRFDKEITKSKLEIQEQALQNISWEIHDNVGQLLSVAKMQLNILQLNVPQEQQSKIQETGDIVSKSLQELRGLAKSLNPDTIKNRGLEESISNEVERFNRLKFVNASLKISGEPFSLSNEKEIILFRIFQEFSNNTLKYSKAKNLVILINYTNNQLEFIAEDDGIGFNLTDESNQNGIGLLNMKSRTKLIGGEIEIKSAKEKGTKIYITCPK